MARKVFEANEPLDLLFGHDTLGLQNELATATDWIEQAHRFRPIDQLISIVETLQFESQLGGDDTVQRRKTSMLYCLARGIIRDNPSINIPELCTQVGLGEGDTAQLTIEAARNALGIENRDLSVSLLQSLKPLKNLEVVKPSWRRLAVSLARDVGEIALAKSFLRTLRIPSLSQYKDSFRSSEYEDGCRVLYRTSAIAKLLEIELPCDDPPEDKFLMSLQNNVTELAFLRASSKAEKNISPVSRLQNVIQFIAFTTAGDGHSHGYRFYPTLGWFAGVVVDIADRFGNEIYGEIISYIDGLVENDDNNLSRSDLFRLKFIEAAYRCDHNQDDARRRIEAIESAIRSDRTPQDAVRFRADIAKAFCQVGSLDRAWKSLAAMHDDTFGYWLRAKKEPQYEFWAWAYLRACDADPACCGDFAKEFGRFILGMDETEGDETARRLIGDLLQGGASSPPVVAALIDRLIESSLTSWAEIASSCLRGVATHNPHLSILCIDLFSRLVVPFYDGADDNFVPTVFGVLPIEKRREAVDTIIDAALRWCPSSRRAGLLASISKAAPEFEVELTAVILRVRSATSLFFQENSDSHKNSGDTVSIDYDASTFAELATQGDGHHEHGNGVDYMYARAACAGLMEPINLGHSMEKYSARDNSCF